MIPIHVFRAEFAEATQSQRDFLRALANRLDEGEQLVQASDRQLVATILRAHADRIPDSKPRNRGQRPRIPPGDAALLFAAYTAAGMKKTYATSVLSDLYNVSIEAMRRSLKKHSAEAAQFTSFMVGKGDSGTKKK